MNLPLDRKRNHDAIVTLKPFKPLLDVFQDLYTLETDGKKLKPFLSPWGLQVRQSTGKGVWYVVHKIGFRLQKRLATTLILYLSLLKPKKIVHISNATRYETAT